MRHTILGIAALFLAAGFTAGCKSREGTSAIAPKQGEIAAAQLDKAKLETKEAAQSMREYAYAEKAEFVNKMKKELVDIQGELDRLGAKVDRASGAAKADAKVKLATVREKWTQTKQQLDRAETATASNWDEVKNGFKQSYADLKNSFEKTRQWLSDKIAP
jgi:Arc/MetJ family transcription regulator